MKTFFAVWTLGSIVLGLVIGRLLHSFDENPKPKKNTWTEEELRKLWLR